MDIHIFSLEDAVSYQPDKPTHAIKIYSSFSDFRWPLQNSPFYVSQFEYVFDDNFGRFQAGPVSITPNLADKLVRDFAEYISQVKALLVHCSGGKNRAPAVAIALNETFELGANTKELKRKFPDANWEVYEMVLQAGRRL